MGNRSGTSSPGTAFGITLSAIPWNAGIISDKSILTPVMITVIQSPNCNPFSREKLIISLPSLTCCTTHPGPLIREITKNIKVITTVSAIVISRRKFNFFGILISSKSFSLLPTSPPIFAASQIPQELECARVNPSPPLIFFIRGAT